jgi:hypothetical protein
MNAESKEHAPGSLRACTEPCCLSHIDRAPGRSRLCDSPCAPMRLLLVSVPHRRKALTTASASTAPSRGHSVLAVAPVSTREESASSAILVELRPLENGQAQPLSDRRRRYRWLLHLRTAPILRGGGKEGAALERTKWRLAFPTRSARARWSRGGWCKDL